MLTALIATALVAQTCLDFPGATYTENQPNGAVVALFPGSHLELNHQRVEFASPGLDPLYTRLAKSGTRVAGQGWADGQAWEFVAGLGWRVVDPAACGVSPVLYLHDDTLLVSHCAGVGSQGYRYQDASGRVWTGDQTYGDVAAGLYEYTECGGIRIGQGAFGGVLAIDEQGRRFLLEPGDTRFIRYNCAGSMLAVSVVKFAERKSRACWFTREQLIGFPPYPDGTPDPDDDPDPDDPPPPPPVECGTVPVVGQNALRELAATFPDLIRSANEDDRRQWARMAAEQMAFSVSPNWGTKKAGQNNPPSKDAIAKFVGATLCAWDIVDGNTRELRFGEGEPIPGQVFIPVDPKNHLGAAPPPPPPPDLEARVTVLEQRVAELLGFGDSITTLDQRITALEQRPSGVPEETVLVLINESLKGLRVVGSTSRAWGHSHQIDLVIRR